MKGCLLEGTLTRRKTLMDTLAVAEFAPVTFQLWDSLCNCKALWCSDKTCADRALYLYYLTTELMCIYTNKQ